MVVIAHTQGLVFPCVCSLPFPFSCSVFSYPMLFCQLATFFFVVVVAVVVFYLVFCLSFLWPVGFSVTFRCLLLGGSVLLLLLVVCALVCSLD